MMVLRRWTARVAAVVCVRGVVLVPSAAAAQDFSRGGPLWVVASLPNVDSAWEGELGKINGVVNVASVDATAQAAKSQLLQSLIRNTGSAPHELQWSNTFGHGTVNATRVLQEDPGADAGSWEKNTSVSPTSSVHRR
ncbi:hypothetical protein [Microbacterium sp. Leaf320]|uniref:hypothetical protein n=1 Tax=Microbacterium sp. Leaf320 TaxID=1736334 RepID=UPI0006F41D56|nr:hypothetical protein [Microbacterium sp. Leaf320]KQQ68548.1 hypothetical protein ASF63_00600 [Microbacterium sp. Leaf320]